MTLLTTGLGNACRLFFSPKIPFYADRGKYWIPLRLDGTPVATGVREGDEAGVRGWLERNSRYFVRPNPDYSLFTSKETFLAAHRPLWLENIFEEADRRIRGYCEKFPAEMRKIVGYDFIHFLESRWAMVAPIIGGLLYVGDHPEIGIHINDLDLALVSAPWDVEGISGERGFTLLAGLCRLALEFQSGMITRFLLQSSRENRELYDPATDLPGRKFRVPGSRGTEEIYWVDAGNRPRFDYDVDEGSLSLHSASREISATHAVFNTFAEREPYALMSFYLFAHYQLGFQDILKLHLKCESLVRAFRANRPQRMLRMGPFQIALREFLYGTLGLRGGEEALQTASATFAQTFPLEPADYMIW